jgi:hypothetical protein
MACDLLADRTGSIFTIKPMKRSVFFTVAVLSGIALVPSYANRQEASPTPTPHTTGPREFTNPATPTPPKLRAIPTPTPPHTTGPREGSGQATPTPPKMNPLDIKRHATPTPAPTGRVTPTPNR